MINNLNISTMKKILLFMLPIMALCLASCEKNNGTELSGDDIIQFEDAHFLHALLCVQEIYIERYDMLYMVDVDRNRDGQISVNEAQNVLALELYNYETNEYFNVLSMPEIKYFTSLTYLDCRENQLTSLDISNNTALTYLACDGNQLTELDLRNNTALEELWCDENQLTSLDLSNNTALTMLGCADNQLTSLDVSNNTALFNMYCYNNQFTTLDLSNNADLNMLMCGGNNLTKILLLKNNNIYEPCIQDIIEEYGDIIEYVE